MRVDELQVLVRNIRTLALSNSFVVLRNNKAQQWKNQLLQCLSAEVVRNHLLCLHPFQYFGSNPSAGVYAFKVNFYADHINLKVNIKTCEVLSFHYDELPPDDIMPAHIANTIDSVDDLQIIAEPFKAGGYQASFAVGSHIVVVPVYPEFHDGAHWIDAGQYSDALEEMAKGKQRNVLRKLEAFDKEAIKNLLGPVYDYGIMSYTDGQLQMISVCYDLWRKHPGERWLQDTAVDLILKQDEKTQKQFAGQLYPTMPALPEGAENPTEVQHM